MNNNKSGKSNSKSPTCPVDKSELTIDRANSSMQCPECNRVYYANLYYDDKQKEQLDEYDDLETVSPSNFGSGAGPILLSSAHDKDDFELSSATKQDDSYEKMIRKQFGDHVTVTTEVDIPH